MAHEDDPIEQLDLQETLGDCIKKIKESGELMNHMWHPDEEH